MTGTSAAQHRDVQGEWRLLVDGKLVEAAGGGSFANIDPATEKSLGDTADGMPLDMEAAIAAARRAFDETSWSTDHAFRSRCLEQLHAALVAHKEELRQVVVAEAGSPIALTYAIQVDLPIEDVPHYAALAQSYPYDQPMPERDVFGQRTRRLVLREATGVVGAITPWNFPFFLNMAKLSPALAAGNTVVLKPAPDTPWSATVLGRIIAEETDIPAGVVNVVASSDHLVGEVLTTDPRVDMVTFTGSTVTGRRIMAKGSDTVKKVFLELGGKSANIVLEDVEDLTAACSGGAFAVCVHAGQGCAITTRLLLPRSRYDEGVELAKATLDAMSFGDPWDPSNLMGPLVSAKQRDRVLGYIEKGKSEARLVRGGSIPADRPTGYFVEPTLFADVDPKAAIAQEEIFGPVLVVIPYADEDDAVRIANDSIYGLSGAVTSASEERALAVARRIRTGTVSVNGGVYLAPDVPFGGYRQSGVGREHGREGFEEYLETKTVAIAAQGAGGPKLGSS
ncbi:MAG TPA: aldehyde dehydrogenase family protein [Acidimicrobiales bacterium]|nr:aldehyde dehydrogenase family protein [Acidimicrobiales bacterium]